MLVITLVYCAMPLVLVGMQRYSDIDANAATRPTRWRFLVAGMKWSRTFSWASYMRCSPWPPRTRTTLCAVMVVHGGSGGTRTVVSGCYAWSVRPFAIELRRHVCKTRVLKTSLDLDDTFSKFRDPEIWFYKYIDLFENARQV
jgi:hypothetical protein